MLGTHGLPRLMLPVLTTINLGQNNVCGTFEIALNPSTTRPQIYILSLQQCNFLQQGLSDTILILFGDGAGLPSAALH